MELNIAEKIKIIMEREGVTMTTLAERVGQSRQNLTNKMKRNSFSEVEIRNIAAAIGYEFVTEFRKVDEELD